MYELGEKVLLLPLAPARRGDFGARFDYGIYLGCRSFDGQAYIGTPSGVIRCRTVRQLSAQERWDTEFVLSIKGTPWSPDGVRVDLPEGRGDRGVHPPDVEPPIIPFEQELGIWQTTLSDVAKGLSRSLSRSLRKSLKELPGSLATERELSEPGMRSEPENESRGP